MPPVVVPPAVTVGASLVPLMVTDTVVSVPSTVATVKVRITTAPAANACVAVKSLFSV